MKFCKCGIQVLLIALFILTPIHSMAAEAVDVSTLNQAALMSLIKPVNRSNTANITISGNQLNETNRDIDFNHTTHIRLKQTFVGLPVWGGDIVVHVKASTATPSFTANGTTYEKLNQDLVNQPTKENKELAKLISSIALKQYQTNSHISNLTSQLMVYIKPEEKKAVWAYLVKFTVISADSITAEPAMIVDTNSHEIYLAWDELESETLATSIVKGGGIGGNLKTGKLYFDDRDASHAAYPVKRVSSLNPFSNDFNGRCYLDNEVVSVAKYEFVKDISSLPYDVYSYPCKKADPQHNNIYWDDKDDSENGGYAPANDGIFASMQIIKMFNDWYQLPIIAEDDGKTAMKLTIMTNTVANASWDKKNERLMLGLSNSQFDPNSSGFYPFTSAGTVAHEMGHAFTTRHANLIYLGGSGAMNEAFSDLTDQAIKFYMTGKNDWIIGSEIVKDGSLLNCSDTNDCALRYMNDPKRDGHSIDNINDMTPKTNVHFSSGIFNKMFYVLAKQPGWDVKKTLDVMVQANRFYWTNGTGTSNDFKPIACGIIAATKALQAKDNSYDVNSVLIALKSVGFTDDGNPNAPNFELADIKSCE